MDKKINRKLLVLGGLIVLALVLSSLAPRLLGDSLTKVNLGQALQGPSSSEWFGTDALGRSVFARAVSGGAETVLPALMILMLIAAVGSFIGVTSAFIGGKFPELLTGYKKLGRLYWENRKPAAPRPKLQNYRSHQSHHGQSCPARPDIAP